MNAEDPFVRALTGDDAEQSVTLVRHYRAPITAVWNAFTTPARIARWYGTITGSRCRAPSATDSPWTSARGWSASAELGELRRARSPWPTRGGRATTTRASSSCVSSRSADDETRLSVQHDRLRPHRHGAVRRRVGAEPRGSRRSRRRRRRRIRGAPPMPAPSAGSTCERTRCASRCRSSSRRPGVGGVVDRRSARGLVVESLGRRDDRRRHPRRAASYRIDAARARDRRRRGSTSSSSPERRLAFTWIWTDEDGASRDEAVDVTFRERAGGTDVVVRHTGPWDSDAPADSYRQGWEFVLAELARRVGLTPGARLRRARRGTGFRGELDLSGYES